MNNLSAAIEAMLFASGEAVEVDKIAQALEIKPDEAEKTIISLRDDYVKRISGLRIVKINNGYQLCSAQEYVKEIRALLEIKRNTPLSQAAFEVLAVVSYNQPVTKAFIEQVRGVDCSGVIGNLIQKKLIEEKGRLDLPGRPLLYGTTDDFLRCFQLESLDELPELPKNTKVEENDNQISIEEAVRENLENSEETDE